MDANTSNKDYKDRSLTLTIIGILLLVSGIAVGLLGPLEMNCFYWFSEGGRFHYEGFGFGSFMFGNIASQIVGYYLLAALLIPLGYGHLRKQQWARSLSVTLLLAWQIVGAPLIIVVLFILAGTKDLSLPAALGVLIFLGLSYLIFPGLLIRFYQGRNVKRTFEVRDAKPSWIEALPISILVLSSLNLFYIIVLHILILFNGIFPAFGFFLFGFQGILLLDLSIACLICLVWGMLRQKLWAWWGSVIFWGLFTFSVVLTFCRYSYLDILSGLAFPPREIEFLDEIPVQGYHFAILVGLPLLITWVMTVLSKRHFRSGAKN